MQGTRQEDRRANVCALFDLLLFRTRTTNHAFHNAPPVSLTLTQTSTRVKENCGQSACAGRIYKPISIPRSARNNPHLVAGAGFEPATSEL